MIYNHLFDSGTKELKFKVPDGYTIEAVEVDGMYYPSLLRVNNLINTEYSELCFRDAILWVRYGLDSDEDDEPVLPLLSEWVNISKSALAKIPDVVFKFEPGFNFPECGEQNVAWSMTFD